MEELMLSMAYKKNDKFTTTIKCRNKKHYDSLKLRFEQRGYIQIPYVKEEIKDTLPF